MSAQNIINSSIKTKVQPEENIDSANVNTCRNFYNSELLTRLDEFLRKCQDSEVNPKIEMSDVIDSSKQLPIFEFVNVLEEPFVVTRTTDTCDFQLGSQQDVVYTTKKNIDENTTEWTLALFDGHGSVKCQTNPYTQKVETEKFNTTLLALDEMMKTNLEGTEKTVLDSILERDIFSPEEDPSLAMQRFLSKECLDKKFSMRGVGATMVLVKVLHNSLEKKIIVEVLSVGDSTAVVYQNGEKVLETVPHTAFNKEEVERLTKQNRLSSYESITESPNFEILDENVLTPKVGLYANFKGQLLAATQSIGHIDYSYGKVLDETGITGLEPFKARFEFADTDDINIKLFSDGVSDVVNKSIHSDIDFMVKSTATETATLAKERWEKNWKVCKKENWPKYLEEGDETIFNTTPFSFVNSKMADDVSCISWIQKRNP